MIVKKRSKRAFFLVKISVFSLLLLLTTACMERELNQRTLVSLVGVDQKEDGTIEMTAGFIETQPKGESDRMDVFTSEGKTLFEAARKFIPLIGKQPIWAYVKVVILGPSVVKEDVVSVLDFFNRNDEVQPNPFIAVSQVPAKEIVNMKFELSALPSVILEEQLTNQSLLALAPQVELFQFSEMIYTHGSVGYTAMVKKSRQNGKFVPMVEGMAVFKGGKKVGEMNRKETRGVLWMRNEVKGGTLVLPLEGGNGSSAVKMGAEILGTDKVRIYPVVKDSKLSVAFHVDCRVGIGDILGSISAKQTGLEMVKKNAETQIEKEIRAALNAAQRKFKADVFGIGRSVQRKERGYWKTHKDQWDKIFPEVPVEINVSVKIEEAGLIKPVPQEK